MNITNKELAEFKNDQVKEFADNLLKNTFVNIGEKAINFDKYNTEIAKSEITNPLVGKTTDPKFFASVYKYITSTHQDLLAKRTEHLNAKGGHKTDSTYKKIDKYVTACVVILRTMTEIAKTFNIDLSSSEITAKDNSEPTMGDD